MALALNMYRKFNFVKNQKYIFWLELPYYFQAATKNPALGRAYAEVEGYELRAREEASRFQTEHWTREAQGGNRGSTRRDRCDYYRAVLRNESSSPMHDAI